MNFQSTTPTYKNLELINCLLASTTELTNTSALVGRSAIGYQKKDQVSGVNQTSFPALGTLDYEASIFHTAAPSEKLTPAGATPTFRLRTVARRFPVQAGEALAISVWVRKTALYTGSTVRLLQFSNGAIGLNDETVLDSMTAGADTWEQLAGTVAVASEDGIVDVCVEVDGSAGIVYVDDWAAAVA